MRRKNERRKKIKNKVTTALNDKSIDSSDGMRKEYKRKQTCDCQRLIKKSLWQLKRAKPKIYNAKRHEN
jgi:hypothetical protein